MTMRIANTDCVKQKNSIVLQAPSGHGKIAMIVLTSDVLEHAHTYDAIKSTLYVAIVLQTKLKATRAVRFKTRHAQELQFLWRQVVLRFVFVLFL